MYWKARIMIGYLLKRFVPGHENGMDESVRRRIGTLAGAVGIGLNLALFALKLAIGLISGSVAVLSDALNNISDSGSSLVALIGMRVAGRRPDREHPFGHGRAEHVSALVVALLIMLVASELLKESAVKLFRPQPIALSPAMLVALGASALVKLWMYGFNRSLGRKIESGVLMAAAVDSRNDVFVTCAIMVSAFVSARFGWNADAPAGIAVSILLLIGGLKITREVISQLLGRKPDPQLVEKISRMILEGEGIIGAHDLIVHDYGPGRQMASVHAEVSADADIRKAHEAIDAIERRIQAELGVPVVIHMDPVAVGCAQTDEARARMEALVASVNPEFEIHDFRVAQRDGQLHLIFDLEVPGEMDEAERRRAVGQIESAARADDPHCRLVIQVDSRYAP
jgi:cation diffusion facilitator family transporter